MFLFQDSIEGQTETISKSSETLFMEKTEVCQFAFRYPKQASFTDWICQAKGGRECTHIFYLFNFDRHYSGTLLSLQEHEPSQYFARQLCHSFIYSSLNFIFLLYYTLYLYLGYGIEVWLIPFEIMKSKSQLDRWIFRIYIPEDENSAYPAYSY